MLLKQLQYFVTAIDEKNFTEAAEKHYISQSAVSQAIQALERDLGVKLLVRRNRTFYPTPAGEYLYRRSKKLLGELEQMVSQTQRIAGGADQSLCVAYPNLYAGPECLDAVAEFSAAHADISVSTFTGTHEEIYKGLLSGAIDLALSDQRRAFREDYVNLELPRADCMVEIAERKLQGDSSFLELSQMPGLPCVLIAPREYRDTEMNYYRDAFGLQGDFLFAANLEEARFIVTSGRGFLLIEALGRLPNPPKGVRRIPLYRGGQKITRKYCLFWKKDRSNEHIEEFARLLHNNLGNP